jgi:hypothetical protein
MKKSIGIDRAIALNNQIRIVCFQAKKTTQPRDHTYKIKNFLMFLRECKKVASTKYRNVNIAASCKRIQRIFLLFLVHYRALNPASYSGYLVVI